MFVIFVLQERRMDSVRGIALVRIIIDMIIQSNQCMTEACRLHFQISMQVCEKIWIKDINYPSLCKGLHQENLVSLLP